MIIRLDYGTRKIPGLTRIICTNRITMAKQKPQHRTQSPVKFRRLVIALSESIGRHQIPVVFDATHPKRIINSDAVHYDLVKKIFLSIYRANRCYHLNAGIEFHQTFDALGKIQAELMHSITTDVDQIELLHTIGRHTGKFFEDHNSLPTESTICQSTHSSSQTTATIARFG